MCLKVNAHFFVIFSYYFLNKKMKSFIFMLTPVFIHCQRTTWQLCWEPQRWLEHITVSYYMSESFILTGLCPLCMCVIAESDRGLWWQREFEPWQVPADTDGSWSVGPYSDHRWFQPGPQDDQSAGVCRQCSSRWAWSLLISCLHVVVLS